jgi:hypothetical protein
MLTAEAYLTTGKTDSGDESRPLLRLCSLSSQDMQNPEGPINVIEFPFAQWLTIFGETFANCFVCCVDALGELDRIHLKERFLIRVSPRGVRHRFILSRDYHGGGRGKL